MVRLINPFPVLSCEFCTQFTTENKSILSQTTFQTLFKSRTISSEPQLCLSCSVKNDVERNVLCCLMDQERDCSYLVGSSSLEPAFGVFLMTTHSFAEKKQAYRQFYSSLTAIQGWPLLSRVNIHGMGEATKWLWCFLPPWQRRLCFW